MKKHQVTITGLMRSKKSWIENNKWGKVRILDHVFNYLFKKFFLKLKENILYLNVFRILCLIILWNLFREIFAHKHVILDFLYLAKRGRTFRHEGGLTRAVESKFFTERNCNTIKRVARNIKQNARYDKNTPVVYRWNIFIWKILLWWLIIRRVKHKLNFSSFQISRRKQLQQELSVDHLEKFGLDVRGSLIWMGQTSLFQIIFEIKVHDNF